MVPFHKTNGEIQLFNLKLKKKKTITNLTTFLSHFKIVTWVPDSFSHLMFFLRSQMLCNNYEALFALSIQLNNKCLCDWHFSSLRVHQLFVYQVHNKKEPGSKSLIHGQTYLSVNLRHTLNGLLSKQLQVRIKHSNKRVAYQTISKLCVCV